MWRGFDDVGATGRMKLMTRSLTKPRFTTLFARVVVSVAAFVLTATTCPAASKDLGNGFRDHGVAVPISNHRGTVATVDGEGRRVVLVWMMDHRGGYALLRLDAETGKAEQFPIPFANDKGDSPYASVLSSANRFYTHFGDYFVEFDPVKRAFTFSAKTTPQMAMGMTEDDSGVIWSVTYPQSGVISFNPKTREFRDYGHVYKQNWPQYQRHVAADDAGWIYFGMGLTESQIVAFDPQTSTAKAMLTEGEREKGTAYVYRDLDGKVYGQSSKGAADKWIEFHNGEARRIGTHTAIRPKPIITDNQALFHPTFPDGTRIKTCNLIERQLVIEDPKTSTTREFSFDYTSEGAHVMGLALSPDGTICGGTSFPMRFFSLDTVKDALLNRPGYNQWNTVVRQGDRFFIGGYGGGVLMEWDPAKPWVNTDANNAASNPLFLTKIAPVINRPMELVAPDDGKTVIMGGTPQYGYTGGGLLFWDRVAKKPTVLKDTDVVPDQSTLSMVALPTGKLLGGTTTEAGTGGEKKATEAVLYLMDPASRKVEWKQAVLPGVQNYTDMCTAPRELVYGFADRKLFFVFDPKKREVVHQQDMEPVFGLTGWHQGPRMFIAGPAGRTFVLFLKGIGEIDHNTFKMKMVAESPVPAQIGGDYHNGRIYFAHGSHLYSYELD